MRYKYTTHRSTLLLSLVVSLSVGFASTAWADEPANGTEAEEATAQSNETSEDTPGSEIINPEKTGLQLGDDVSTDDALARVEGGDTSNPEKSSESPQPPGQEKKDSGNVCEPYPSCVRADLGEHRGAVDFEKYQSVAQSYATELRACFSNALENGESGRIVLAFTIDSDGEPAEVVVRRSTIGGEKSRNCTRDAASDWTFPEPPASGPDAGSFQMTHPFKLGTDE